MVLWRLQHPCWGSAPSKAAISCWICMIWAVASLVVCCSGTPSSHKHLLISCMLVASEFQQSWHPDHHQWSFGTDQPPLLGQGQGTDRSQSSAQACCHQALCLYASNRSALCSKVTICVDCAKLKRAIVQFFRFAPVALFCARLAAICARLAGRTARIFWIQKDQQLFHVLVV